MSKLRFLMAGLLFPVVVVAQMREGMGFKEIELDPDAARPLHVAVWYPTADRGSLAVVGESRVFHGIPVQKQAAIEAGVHPLVVMSHGDGGSWRNLSWLAGDLARQGYIVAAPDHPGTTAFNRSADQARRLWERPRDLSRVIDALMADPNIAGEVDAQGIAAIGYSLGGWTVTALAGAKFDTQQFEKSCQDYSSLRACQLVATLGLTDPALEQEMGDLRIGTFVTLDLGLARGFSPESLAKIRIPSLVIGAGTDIGDMSAPLESGYLIEHLPKASATYVEIPEAMHFSFMQLCKPGAAARLADETPWLGIFCRDGRAGRREDIHRTISALVRGFLSETLPATE